MLSIYFFDFVRNRARIHRPEVNALTTIQPLPVLAKPYKTYDANMK